MEKKRTMAKAIFAFAITMAGTIAGNMLYHHFKGNGTANKDFTVKAEPETDGYNSVIPEDVPDVHTVSDEKTVADETIWNFMAQTEPKDKKQEDKAEAIWQELQRLDAKEEKKEISVDNAKPKHEAFQITEPIEKPAKNNALSERENLVLEMHEMFGGSMTTKQIVEQTGMGRSTVDRIKKNLIDMGYRTAEGKKLKKANSGIDWNQADEMIISGKKSDTEIARLFQCDNSSISKRRKMLKESGRLTA